MKKIVFLIMVIPIIATAGTVNVVSSFAGPDIYPNGLAWDGTYLWLNGGGNDAFYMIDPSDGTVLDQFTPSEPSSNANGATFDGTHLWGSYWDDQDIYSYETDGDYAGSFSVTFDWASGLAWDGTNMWLACSVDDTIYEYETDGTELGSFSSPDSDPNDLAFAGTHLWIAIERYIYRVETDGTVVDTFDMYDINTSFTAQALTYDGSNFWVSDQTSDMIYEVELTTSSIQPTSLGNIKSLFE